MERISRTVQLEDGSTITIRLLTKEDGPALHAFFCALPESDRLFLKEDATQKDVIDRWMTDLDYEKTLPLVAEKDSAIIGSSSLHFSKYGWQRHMADIRCVVAKGYQKMGLGDALMRELVAYANNKGISMIKAKIMDVQQSAQRTFQRLGFKKEAELKNFVVDIYGKTHNLVIMVNNASELWKKMEDLLLYHDTRLGD
jgi:RimJ/RimL family protein N-acetyltransferase